MREKRGCAGERVWVYSGQVSQVVGVRRGFVDGGWSDVVSPVSSPGP